MLFSDLAQKYRGILHYAICAGPDAFEVVDFEPMVLGSSFVAADSDVTVIHIVLIFIMFVY